MHYARQFLPLRVLIPAITTKIQNPNAYETEQPTTIDQCQLKEQATNLIYISCCPYKDLLTFKKNYNFSL